MSFSFQPKKSSLAAALEEEAERKRQQASLIKVNNKSIEQQEREAKGYAEPKAVADKIGIIFDDSGSMGGGKDSKIEDAQQGTIEFLKNCTINRVAAAVYPMNKERIALETDLPKIAALIPHIQATGGTPMFETWQKVIDEHQELKFTRLIIFSDGSPTDGGLDWNHNRPDTTMAAKITWAQEQHVPVDTVFITQTGWTIHDREYKTLKVIADLTGGIFLVFDRDKVNFRQAFKYLSPGLRYMLSDKSFIDKLEEGRVV